MWRGRIIILIMIFVGLALWQGIQDIHEANLAEARETLKAAEVSLLAERYERVRFKFSLGYIAFCVSGVLLLKKYGYWHPPTTIEGSQVAEQSSIKRAEG